jgi:hypothetical protein
MNNVIVIDSNKFDIGLEKRISRKGPELDLVNQFIDNTTNSFKHKRNKMAIFVEPLVDTAYPDIVFAEYDPSLLEQWQSSRNSINTTDIKIFDNIRAMRGAKAETIVSKTHFNYKTVLLSLERLLDAGLINRTNNQWISKPLKEIYSIKRLLSVEAKIGEWDTLLNQADANRWFASESYALSSVKNPKPHTIQRFKEYGVGLYGFSDGEVVEFNKAEKQGLPTSYMSWMFNEWVGRYVTQQ